MYKAVGYNSLGETLLIHTLSSAYYAMTKKPILREGNRIREGQNCLVFMQDSGLHKIITTFGLYYDPDKLRNMFFYYVHIA